MHKSLIFLFSKGLILKIFWCLHCGLRLLLELNRCILGFNSIGNSYSIDGVLIPFMEFLQFILLGNCTETVLGLFITGGDIDWGDEVSASALSVPWEAGFISRHWSVTEEISTRILPR